mgnify:CR=1 FL=1
MTAGVEHASGAQGADSLTHAQATIERLAPPVFNLDLRALAQLLVDAVESGAAVSFLAPLAVDEAEAWWRRTLTAEHSRAMVLVARLNGAIVGTVQLHPAWSPNQPHRAEIAKLLVHSSARGQGLGARLMRAVETEARGAGLRLLTLDAKRGAVAGELYRSLGWTMAGEIPRFALDTDGRTCHDAVIYCKELANADPVPPLPDSSSRLEPGNSRPR